MTQKTRTQIKADIDTVVVENTSLSLTATALNTLMDDMADSFITEDDSAMELIAKSVNTSDGYKVGGVQVVGVQGDNLPALSGGASLSDVIRKVNAIITELEKHGMLATKV